MSLRLYGKSSNNVSLLVIIVDGSYINGYIDVVLTIPRREMINKHVKNESESNYIFNRIINLFLFLMFKLIQLLIK